MVHLPVAVLQRSLPHGEHLGKAQRKESIAVTITSFHPHGPMPVVDLRLSGHIIVFEMPVVDPTKQESHFLSIGYIPERNVIGQTNEPADDVLDVALEEKN